MSHVKPSQAEIDRAKACPHLHQEEFIDFSFTGVGVCCTDCRLLMRWVVKPDWLVNGTSSDSPHSTACMTCGTNGWTYKKEAGANYAVYTCKCCGSEVHWRCQHDHGKEGCRIDMKRCDAHPKPCKDDTRPAGRGIEKPTQVQNTLEAFL